MGIDDKVKNAAQDVAGKVKEGVGHLTDNERLEAEGKIDQAAAAAKKNVEKAKDAVNDHLDR
ncbi:MAG: CsbD family protein [Actinobacteria bacterium]|nr:CsbD family protein [Actinomycetota bacterium]